MSDSKSFSETRLHRPLPGPLFSLQRLSLGVVRRAIGLTEEPITPCFDPDTSYQPVNGVIRVVHADLPTMTIGGVASLFLQLLHPQVVAGVADHSRYEQDPLGRLQATGRFLAVTTYGTADQAAHAIHRVSQIHTRVNGLTEEGEPYDASRPDLLEWVHLAEVAMFDAAFHRYGPRFLSAPERDEYVTQMAQVARDLGVPAPPESLAALYASIETFRPTLRLTRAGESTRDFILAGPYNGPQRRGYQTVVMAALDLLPPWALVALALPSDFSMPPQAVIRRRAKRLSMILRLATSAAHPANHHA